MVSTANKITVVRPNIVKKINSAHENPNLEFTQEEIEYMVTRYLSSHSRSKVGNVKLFSYIDGDKEEIGLRATLKLKYE
jgi:hypothetical protein